MCVNDPLTNMVNSCRHFIKHNNTTFKGLYSNRHLQAYAWHMFNLGCEPFLDSDIRTMSSATVGRDRFSQYKETPLLDRQDRYTAMICLLACFLEKLGTRLTLIFDCYHNMSCYRICSLYLNMSSNQHSYAVNTASLSATHDQTLISHLRNTYTNVNVVHV